MIRFYTFVQDRADGVVAVMVGLALAVYGLVVGYPGVLVCI